MADEPLKITFDEDAWESAMTVLIRLEGWVVKVHPRVGPSYRATILTTDEPDGEKPQLVVSPEDDNNVKRLQIFGDIDRLEVL